MFSSSFIWHLLIWYMLKSYKLNDVLFFIHMAFAYLVYAEKLQVCHRVLLEVRLDMFFFCVYKYIHHRPITSNPASFNFFGSFILLNVTLEFKLLSQFNHLTQHQSLCFQDFLVLIRCLN